LAMDSNSDKRAFERRSCNASMVFSYVNQPKSYDTRVLNCSTGGMCFQSSLFLQPGATVCIRVKEFKCSDAPEDYADDLHSMSLAEVKWCHRLPGAESAAYGVGVKYQAPAY